jgi:hypothetical protein
MASMNYFDSDMYNSTNTVVYFDEKDGNLYLIIGLIWILNMQITFNLGSGGGGGGGDGWPRKSW